MKIIHRVSIRATDDIRRELAALGVTIGEGLATFEVDEADPRWREVEQFIARHRAVDVVRTKSSAKELSVAKWLAVEPSWHFGYPQPENGYLQATYDLSEYCPECGTGAVQKAPFRMRGEPKWGGKSILQLNWVFDEYFTRPEVWEAVFLPLGIGSHPVIDHKSSAQLQTVVQCDFGSIAPAKLDLRDHPYRHCSRCERRRYLPFTRGCFPRLCSERADIPAFKSVEYFGDGAQSYRAVIVSQHVHAAVANAGLKGWGFTPMCA
jgi:hypothetical protein